VYYWNLTDVFSVRVKDVEALHWLLAASICQAYPEEIRSLRIDRVSNGIVLYGVADSHAVKQLILAEVRRRYPVRVVENRIVLEAETLSCRKQLTEVC